MTEQIKRVIQSRHRAESVYNITNLTQLVKVAEQAANALTLMLLGVAFVVLLVSGIGIMNIMLATVSARIREIGIRKALGATNREIRFQFLSEAILISVGGGLVGVVIGLAIPYSVRFLTEYRIPISGTVGDRGDPGFVAGRSGVRHGPGDKGGEAGPGGEPQIRVKPLGAQASGCLLNKCVIPNSASSLSEDLARLTPQLDQAAAPKTRTPGWLARLFPCSTICGERTVTSSSPRISFKTLNSEGI